MQKCPNCGQPTARTEDWACQWCGYPLLSGSYKKVPKTYKQLREEMLPKLEPEPELELEPEPEPEPEPKPKPKRVTKPAPEPEPKPAPAPKAVPQPAAIKLTVEELIKAYAADAAAADAKFVNQILKVTGAVDRLVLQDNLDIHYITLTNAEGNLLQNVRCMLIREHDSELNKLTRGQIVTVQGIFDGSVINLRLKDCVLVH